MTEVEALSRRRGLGAFFSWRYRTDVLGLFIVVVVALLYLSPSVKDGFSFGPTDLVSGASVLTQPLFTTAGRTLSAASVSSGSPNLTSSTGAFTANDIGRKVDDADRLVPSGTTILSITSRSVAVMTNDATGNAASESVTLGALVAAHNHLAGDVGDQGVPWNAIDWRIVRDGSIPLWNSTAGTGLPQLFNFESRGAGAADTHRLPVPALRLVPCDGARQAADRRDRHVRLLSRPSNESGRCHFGRDLVHVVGELCRMARMVDLRTRRLVGLHPRRGGARLPVPPTCPRPVAARRVGGVRDLWRIPRDVRHHGTGTPRRGGSRRARDARARPQARVAWARARARRLGRWLRLIGTAVASRHLCRRALGALEQAPRRGTRAVTFEPRLRAGLLRPADQRQLLVHEPEQLLRVRRRTSESSPSSAPRSGWRSVSAAQS